MKMCAQEMRVVPKYYLKKLYNFCLIKNLKYWAKGKIFWFFYLQFYVVQDLATRGSSELVSNFLIQYFRLFINEKL